MTSIIKQYQTPLLIIAAIFALSMCWLNGYKHADREWRAKWAAMERDTAQAQAAELEAVLERERGLRDELQKAQEQAETARRDIESAYAAALSELDGMRGGTGEVPVPTGANPPAPSGVGSTGECRRDSASVKNLQRRILDLGKARDNCAARFNELQSLYKAASK